VTSPASQRLLGHGLQTRGVLLVNGVGADEDGLLGLDDFVAGLNALRTTRRLCQYSAVVCYQWWKNCGRTVWPGPSSRSWPS